jgi:D-amino-acid dehydrogenase
MRFLLNCTASRAGINTDRTLRVAVYSRTCLQRLRAETGIEYDQKTLGILHVYRDPQTFEHAVKAAELMTRLGLPRQVKTPDEAVAIETALSSVGPQLAGGIFTPGDESGDAHKFTQRLAALCAEQGVTFHYGTAINELELVGGRIAGVSTDKGRLRADSYVLSLGSWSPRLARHAGVRLPIYPAKGYSATIAVTDPARAPNVAITDDEHKLVFSRLGDRLRCAGTAELAGWNTKMTPHRATAVAARASALFPGAGDFDRAELWAGLRPVTPDSVPILGRSPIGNLFLNVGHGTLGFTMSCGSAKVVADLVSERAPDIDLNGLGLDRFRML